MQLYKTERRKYKSILELASDAIFILDMKGNIVDYSNQTREQLGYTDQEMKHLNVKMWDKQLTEEEWVNFLDEFKEHSISFERTHTRKDGTTYPANINVGLIELNNKKYIYSSARDITENKKLLQTIKEQTYIDELTNVLNRKAYNEKIVELLAQFDRYHIPFCLMILDIDHFKRINDNYGHKTGDYVLQDLSKCISDKIRTNDNLYRVGGEEFVVLSPGIKIEEGKILAEKIRELIFEQVHTIENVHISVSIGIVEARKGDSTDSIFIHADKCLYKAKEAGRNRVIWEKRDIGTSDVKGSRP